MKVTSIENAWSRWTKGDFRKKDLGSETWIDFDHGKDSVFVTRKVMVP